MTIEVMQRLDVGGLESSQDDLAGAKTAGAHDDIGSQLRVGINRICRRSNAACLAIFFGLTTTV